MQIRNALCALLTLLVSFESLEATEEAFPKASPESQGISSEALAEMVAEVEQYVERDLVVGAELLVIKNRRTVLSQTFGMADREEKRAWDDQTVCNIRSMTKPLTGAAVQILADREELALDDPVALYLPGFENEKMQEVTIRHVLTHRSGLPLTILVDNLREYDSLIDMANAAGGKTQFPLDSKFWYSDSGTDVCGAIVEVVSGQTLDEFIYEELLVPLGMNDSFYYLDAAESRGELIGSLYFGGIGKWMRIWKPQDGPFYPYAWGSQSLYSTPEDYAKFLAMWMDKGKVGEEQVLSPEAVERSLTPVSEMTMLGSDNRFPTFFDGLETYYGQMSVLHVPVANQGKGPAEVIGHSGSDGTIAWAWPEKDLMVLLFTQSRGGGAVLRFEGVLNQALINPGSGEGSEEVPKEIEPLLGTYVADWSNHMKEPFEIEWRKGSLRLDIPSQMVHELVRQGEQLRWKFAISDGVDVWFDQGESGEASALRISQGGMTFEAPRKGSKRELEMADERRLALMSYSKFEGRYVAESGEVFEIFTKGDYLRLKDSDGGETHLWKIPGRPIFQVRENPFAKLQFKIEDGRVKGLIRHAQGAKPLPMKREGEEQLDPIVQVLNQIHQAHEEGDAPRFFEHFAPEAVFFGTAPGERWSLKEYREFSKETFSSGKQRPREIEDRYVTLSPDGAVAWFDERQIRPPNVELRSTGVLTKVDGGWKVALWSLGLPLPNELVPEFQAWLEEAGTPHIYSKVEDMPSVDVLTAFHKAASAADREGYFAALADGSVLYGTDSHERWERETLKTLLKDRFESGKGWNSVPIAQEMVLLPGGKAAWFHERLRNETHPETRATGVLLKSDEGWQIAQFNLTFPVPNEMIERLVPKIKRQ